MDDIVCFVVLLLVSDMFCCPAPAVIPPPGLPCMTVFMRLDSLAGRRNLLILSSTMWF
jgi:hypothetical protein